MRNHRAFAVWFSGVLALFAALYAARELSQQPGDAQAKPVAGRAEEPQTASPGNGAYEAVQELFNRRCVFCHSCNNAPCQLKLISYEGLLRGASKIEAINPTRLQSIPPTRLGIDARSAEEWHGKGFFSVAEGPPSLITSMLNQGQVCSPADHVEYSHSCPSDRLEFETFKLFHPDKLMPYGLPPLTAPERDILVSWVRAGRRPPAAKPEPSLPPGQASAKARWEAFLNGPDLEHRLVARYLYEHLFMASVQFSAGSRQFYRIIRSRKPCDQPLDEIATRRPSDAPTGNFQYCFQPIRETIVEKTLLPYVMDQAKLDRVAGLFFDPREPWKASHWPDYHPLETMNPFVLYQDIPVKARYRFLLEDAQFHVATFIKGPVCYGRGAVSAIDEHFFVFFMSPDSDLMVADRAFAQASESLLVLPFMEGSDAPFFANLSFDEIWASIIHRTAFTDRYIAARNAYMALKDKHRLAGFGQGYRISDFWDGEGTNPNAVLTVFRHFDHSYVLKGLRGGEASSYFVLDYGLFERLVYNLVVGYDVFGNLSHQIHTRLYMEMLRREAEDNFLLFLPPAERVRLRRQWYQRDVDKLGQMIFLDPDDPQFPTRIPYQGPFQTDKELVRKIWGGYLSPAVRGPHDGEPHSEYPPLEAMAQKPASSAPFVNLFPDSALILIEADGKLKKVVTVIRDRAHSALGRLILEQAARVREQDRLAIVEGLATSYPNLFFVVPEERLPDFLQQLGEVKNAYAAQAFIRSWGVLKTNPRFWAISDRLHAYLPEPGTAEFGVLDYTRYGIWSEAGDWHE